MNYETRIHVDGQVGRIKVLPANPRTPRGFSGDLILDEFAFHEDSRAIWEAAEPILSANQDYLARVASTPNGRHNMFYQLATTPGVTTRTVPRSLAWDQGLQIFHPATRQPITATEARELALDKGSYDQNYECVFTTENMALLSYDLISQAETPNIGFVCEDQWSPEALDLLGSPQVAGSLYVGVDVGRNHDWTVITVLEQQYARYIARAILRLKNNDLPTQQERLATICSLPNFRNCCIDMTGLGLGLFEYTQRQFGYRVTGLNFSRTMPLPTRLAMHAPNSSTNVRVPELLALQLLRVYVDRSIQHPLDPLLRDHLRRPERLTSPSGQVSIAADRNSGGHADHFWSMALAVHAGTATPRCDFEVIKIPGRLNIPRWSLI
jgi:phage FluMu gp28-like protein